MQKNPCRVDDPLQNPIDRESYEDAVSLEDGIYPITTDDNTIISSDMVSHGSGTVEQAINSLNHWESESINGGTATVMRNQKLRIINGYISGTHAADETLVSLDAEDYPADNNVRFGIIGTNKCVMGYVTNTGVLAASQSTDGFYGFIVAYYTA